MLTAELAFSSAGPTDLVAVRALLERCHLPAADLLPAHLQNFIVCRDGEALVGSVGLELLGEAALLRSLAVAPTHRERHIAHMLWGQARRLARERGVRTLYLLTTTAAPLFARWGFRAVSREAVPEIVKGTGEYSVLCPSTAVVMRADLIDV